MDPTQTCEECLLKCSSKQPSLHQRSQQQRCSSPCTVLSKVFLHVQALPLSVCTHLQPRALSAKSQLALQRGAEGLPEKQRGMEMMNQREMRLKKASRGMAPLLPVCASSMLSMLRMPSVMPGK